MPLCRAPAVAGAAAALAALGAAAAAALLLGRPAVPAQPSADVVAFMAAGDDDGRFARALVPRVLRFPVDAGPHPDYRTEWWYYTGNLADAAGRRFGFQLTFFRTALTPPGVAAGRTSAWATDEAFAAHFALTDVAGRTFHARERLARGALGLAGAAPEPYRVWLESWSADGRSGPDGAVRLRALDGPVAIDLLTRPAKPPVLHGDRGLSRKGPQPGNASYYYSYSRLATTGVITTAGGGAAVTGLAWMDHEWSTSALDAATQVGWDWFALQLDDGRELMLFQIRGRDGASAVEASGSLVAPDAAVTTLGRADFRIERRGQWRSPRTGAQYPSGWRVEVPDQRLELTVDPLVRDQELETSVHYWEGAVRVAGTAAGRAVAGYGYVELTGYAATGRPPGAP